MASTARPSLPSGVVAEEAQAAQAGGDNAVSGYGTFTWSDGSRYEGDWLNGTKHGQGVYTWPSGSSYDGAWEANAMHGQGVYVAKDGTRYDGSWQQDLKHGLGKKRFPNGDVYEGLWKAGQPHGPGMYKWANGNEYNGEWVGGRMCGRGTFLWTSGERFDGTWKDGREDGRGTFSWPDGSYFDGHWQAGEKHGVGVWAPPLSAAEAAAAAGAPHDAPRESVLLREYDRGVLVREEAVPAAQRPGGEHGAGAGVRKTRRRREVRLGETIIKGAPSYDLMLQLQLGIRWSVGRITPEPAREVGAGDYERCVSAQFPRGGSSTTPPHASRDFKWKDYCPMVFRKLRERFGIDAGDYMLSLCGDMALRELSSPGKSGSVFFLSQDGRFIVKTMRKAEMVHLRTRVLSDYCAHVLRYPDTLLTRFFGLHRVKPAGGSNVRFVVMGNLLCTDHAIHRRYDLKGSTHGRLTESPYDAGKKVLKDLDLEYTFQLADGFAERVKAQIAADCVLLERLNVMDYSLLLGVHFVQRKGPRAQNGGADAGVGANGEAHAQQPGEAAAAAAAARPHRIERSLTAVLASSPSAAAAAATTGPSAVEEEEEEEEDGEFRGEANTLVGENMTAVALPGRVLPAPRGTVQLPLPSDRADVILNFGIIDFLQEYNASKQMEHVWKTAVLRESNISSCDPVEYSHRFQAFMRKLFS